MSDYIPPEVVTQILLNLPVKSLLKFTCVCKDWYSHISNPTFIIKHLALSSNDHTKTLVRHYSKTHSKEIYRVYDDQTFNVENSTRISFPFHEWSNYYLRIVGYCNGVLCLSDDLFKYKDTIILWNPCIKRAFVLPSPRFVVCLSDDFNYMSALGFGFDYVSNDYKVVRVAYTLNVVYPKVEVFSLSSGVWRLVKNSVGCYISELSSQVFFEGAVHWCAYRKSRNNEYDKPFRNVVLRFDLGSEKFDELGLPEEFDSYSPNSIYATTVRGKFCVICTTRRVLHGYMMKESGKVSNFFFSVQLIPGLSKMLKNFKRTDDSLFSGENGELVSYNCENKMVTSTGVLGTSNSLFVDKYVESLALLDKGIVFQGKEPELDYEDKDQTVDAAEKQSQFRSIMRFTSRTMHL